MVALVAPGALVACSDNEPSGGSQSTPTGGGDPTAGGGAKGLAAVAEVPDGGGLVVDNPDGGMVLLVRNGTEVKGYNAACTHQGTTIDAPENGVSTCPNHGSQFDAATGEVRKGPATQPLATVSVKVEGDQVVMA
jgi:cytochrome b6-f complex iron-sulfur subunit